MGKSLKSKAKMEEEEEEKEVIESHSGDDNEEEANEDLSLKIVERALLLKATANSSQNDSNGGAVFDNDSGVISVKNVNGEVGNVKKVKKIKKKKKIQKKETEIETKSIEEEPAKSLDKAEVEKGDANAVVELMEQTVDPNVDTNGVVDQNLVLRKLLRGPRYYDAPSEGSGWSSMCYNCGKEGHMAANCPDEKKLKPCFLCGAMGHSVRQCSKDRECVICKSTGHRPNRCPERHKGGAENRKVCLKCCESGHDMFSCMNVYLVDDLKEIRCYVCKNFGHLCCVNSVDSSPREPSCYQCGELGHTGLDCLRKEGAGAASSNSCFKCGEEGHFARSCKAKAGKRNYEPSTPTLRPHRENKEAAGSKSAPQDLGKSRKKRKSKSEVRNNTTPKKLKQRGRWLSEYPEDHSQSESKSKSKKIHQRSPATLSYKGHKSSYVTTDSYESGSQSYNRMHTNQPGTSSSPYNRVQNIHRGAFATQNDHWGTPSRQDNHWGTPPMRNNNWGTPPTPNNRWGTPPMQNFQWRTPPLQNNNWRTPTLQDSASSYHNRFYSSRYSKISDAGYRGNYDRW